jgi:myosin heavy subunit
MVEALLKQLPPEHAKAVKELEKLPPDQVLAKLEEIIKALPTEQADALKAMMAEGAAEAPADAAPQAAAEQPEASDDSGGGDLPPVVATVRGMYEAAYAVKATAALADRLLSEIEQQAKTAESLSSVTVKDAEALAKLNNALSEKVGALSNHKEISEVARKVSHLKQTLASVKTDLATLVAQNRLKALDDEKRAKAEAEAEKKRLEKEAYEAKVAGEKAGVAEAEAANAELLKQFQFREATRALRDMKERLETPEAEGVALIVLERVRRLQDFHEFLIKKAPGYKSGFGWSIDSADAKALSVGGKKVPWADVFENTQKQQAVVVELIRGLITSDQAAKTLGLREKTRMMTNAALCFKLFYSDTPKAMEYAKNLANEAARQFEADADDIKQLLPEFFE